MLLWPHLCMMVASGSQANYRWPPSNKKQDMVQHYNHSQIRHWHGHVFMMRIISRGTPAAKLAALTRWYSTYHSISEVCILVNASGDIWSLGSSKGETSVKHLVLESIVRMMAWVQCAQVFKHGCCVGGARGSSDSSDTETERNLQYLFVLCESVIATNRWLRWLVGCCCPDDGTSKRLIWVQARSS